MRINNHNTALIMCLLYPRPMCPRAATATPVAVQEKTSKIPILPASISVQPRLWKCLLIHTDYQMPPRHIKTLHSVAHSKEHWTCIPDLVGPSPTSVMYMSCEVASPGLLTLSEFVDTMVGLQLVDLFILSLVGTGMASRTLLIIAGIYPMATKLTLMATA